MSKHKMCFSSSWFKRALMTYIFNTLEVAKFQFPYLRNPSTYLTLIRHICLEVSNSFR